MSLYEIWQIYTVCMMPIALYICLAWFIPWTRGRTKAHNAQIRILEEIQRWAAKIISGGFKIVGKDTFDAKLYLPPMRYYIEVLVRMTLARMATLPLYQNLLRQQVAHS
jgi:hypothetical protein